MWQKNPPRAGDQMPYGGQLFFIPRPRVFLAIGLLFAVLAVAPVAAQERSYPLTVTSVLPRFAASPFETEDWLSEILEIDPETGEEQVVLTLWGANALAYPNAVYHPRWSHGGDQLTMTFVDKQGNQALVLYDPGTGHLQTISPANLTHFSAANWNRADDMLFFSAVAGQDEPQILRQTLPGDEAEVLATGRLPALAGSEDRLAFLDSQNRLALLSLVDGTVETFSTSYPQATSLVWSPDGSRLAMTYSGYVVVIHPESGQPERVYDAYLALAADAQAQTDSVAWSPDSQSLAFISTTQDANGFRSQVVLVAVESASATVIIERFFPLTGEPPSDPRRFLGVSFQVRGAFLPEREARSDM